MKFLVKDINVGIANALRRVIISEIPIYAIDKVVMYQNDTIFTDEYICHRLGFIPISVNNEKEIE
jgi:DNA-directed RNA polymerase II subunit RPB3